MIGIELRKYFKAVGNTDTIFQYSTCNLGKKQIAGKYIPSFLKFFIYFLYQSTNRGRYRAVLIYLMRLMWFERWWEIRQYFRMDIPHNTFKQ